MQNLLNLVSLFYIMNLNVNINDNVYEVLEEILQKRDFSKVEAIERAIIYLSDFLDGCIYDDGEEAIKRGVTYYLDFTNSWNFNKKEERIEENCKEEKCKSKFDGDLDPEFKFTISVKLQSIMNMCTVNFNVKTERDRFIIMYNEQDHKMMYPLTITFKQVRSGNLTFVHGGLWYKIKNYLFSVIDHYYPHVRVTKYRINFMKKFIKKFTILANQFVEMRRQIEDELGPLPHIFSTFLECELPRTQDELYYINGNALKMYNAKAKINRWATIRNLDELAYMISQSFPKLEYSTARKQYRDIHGNKKRGIVLVCDLHAIAHELYNKLNQLM